MLLTVFRYLGLRVTVWFTFKDWPVDEVFASGFIPVRWLRCIANVVVKVNCLYGKLTSACRLSVFVGYGSQACDVDTAGTEVHNVELETSCH